MRIIRLPLAASHVLHGPIMSLQGGRLLLRYDCELGETVEWAEVRFDGVIQVYFRDSSVLEDNDIMGHDYFIEETDTTELSALQGRRREFLGPNAFEQRKDTEHPLKKYRFYFDDVAAVEVVARSVETSFGLPVDPTSTKWE